MYIYCRLSVPKIIDIGPDLLEIFENILGVRFFRHSVDAMMARWCSGWGAGLVIERSRVRLPVGALPGEPRSTKES